MLDKIIEKVGDSYFAGDDRVWKMNDREQIGVNSVSKKPIYIYTAECDGVRMEFSEDGRALGYFGDFSKYLDRRVPDRFAQYLEIVEKVNAMDLKLGEKIVYDPQTGEVGRMW